MQSQQEVNPVVSVVAPYLAETFNGPARGCAGVQDFIEVDDAVSDGDRSGAECLEILGAIDDCEPRNTAALNVAQQLRTRVIPDTAEQEIAGVSREI